jgi:hypothetical protein
MTNKLHIINNMQAVIRNRDRMVIDVISVFASNADESFLWLEIQRQGNNLINKLKTNIIINQS